MNITIFSFTKQASLLSISLYEYFSKQKIPCISYTMEKYVDSIYLKPLEKPLNEHVSDCFQKGNVIIFISACGICVRAIAPFINDKTTDPCVLVIDEKANFVISLLSGHIGGGNEFTLQLANWLKATPVISTATDLNHKFAVDVFAKKNGLLISDMKLAKDISASLLDLNPVGITGILPDGKIPDELTWLSEPGKDTFETPTLGIQISPYSNGSFRRTLHLIPKQVVLGIGCRKDTGFLELRDFVNETLNKLNLFSEAIDAIASIDLKKEEKGLLDLAQHYQVPFITYTAEELLRVPGNFSASSFVKSITGVDNVCERSTLAYSNSDSLVLSKTARQGMTIAISLRKLTIKF